MNYQNFWGHFYDDVFYNDDSYLWSNAESKIEAKDLNLSKEAFWNLLAIKYFWKITHTVWMGSLSLIRQPEGSGSKKLRMLHLRVKIIISYSRSIRCVKNQINVDWNLSADSKV